MHILQGNCLDALQNLSSNSIHCCVTSPPYFGLRDYGTTNQIGLETDPEEYVQKLVHVFSEVKRVLRKDGTLWLNIGDSYSGSGKGPAGNLRKKHNECHMEKKHSAIIPKGTKKKDLIGIPWMLAFALRADGWFLRQDIIWYKPNPMPESVADRCTRSHEYVFLLSKSAKYYYDSKAIKEPTTTTEGTRNKHSVWTVCTKPFKDAHFATFPPELIEPCILAGCPKNGTVLDPFFGSGTTGVVCTNHKRNYIGIELNPKYVRIAQNRISRCGGIGIHKGFKIPR